MDSCEEARSAALLVAAGTWEDPIELDAEDEEGVRERVMDVSSSSNDLDDLYEWMVLSFGDSLCDKIKECVKMKTPS